jgi:hypothetical protein
MNLDNQVSLAHRLNVRILLFVLDTDGNPHQYLVDLVRVDEKNTNSHEARLVIDYGDDTDMQRLMVVEGDSSPGCGNVSQRRSHSRCCSCVESHPNISLLPFHPSLASCRETELLPTLESVISRLIFILAHPATTVLLKLELAFRTSKLTIVAELVLAVESVYWLLVRPMLSLYPQRIQIPSRST